MVLYHTIILNSSTSQNLFLFFCVCGLAIFQVHEFGVLFLLSGWYATTEDFALS